MKNLQQRVAIIGMSGRFPEADHISTLYRNLIDGRDSVRPLTLDRLRDARLNQDATYQLAGYLDRIDGFDHQFFGISRRDAEHMDPIQRITLEMVCEAIEDAGYGLDSFRGSNTAIYLGARPYLEYYQLLENLADPAVLPGNLTVMTAGRASYVLDLRGPSVMLDTACSSSLLAVHEVCVKLIREEIEYAFAGGISVLTEFPEKDAELTNSMGLLSDDGKARSFDDSADGTSIGEGGGILLLKRLDKAIEDGDHIHAVILGSAINQDGRRSSGPTAPSPMGQAETLRKAWKAADVNPETITYIETHGTGTPLGDAVEMKGIQDAFAAHTDKANFCALGAVKTSIGHLENAAGVTSVITAVLSLQERKLFPNIHFSKLNSHIDGKNSPAYVNVDLKDWTSEDGPLRCGVSAFGVSGTNAHLVLEEAPKLAERQLKDQDAYVLKVSARTPQALERYINKINDFLSTDKNPFQDTLYSLNQGRDDYAYKVALSAGDKEGIRKALTEIKEKIKQEGIEEATENQVVFLFPETIERSQELYEALLSWSISREIIETAQAVGVNPENPSPESTLVLQYATHRLLLDWGISPRAVIGTGTGKTSSQVIQGRVSLEDAIKQLQNGSIENKPLDVEKYQKALKKIGEKGNVIALLVGEGGALVENMPKEWKEKSIEVSSQDKLLSTLADLYSKGVKVEWETYHAGQDCRRVSAPTYPFEPTRCWPFEPDEASAMEGASIFQIRGRLAPQQNASAVSIAELQNQFKGWTPTEIKVWETWMALLKADEIKKDEDFFSIGGHSLNGTQMINRLAKEFKLPLNLETLFNNPTIRRLAEQIDQMEVSSQPKEKLPILPLPVQPDYAVSHAQQRMWIMQQLDREGLAYNMPYAWRWTGDIDASALQAAIGKLMERHESFRTSFIRKEEELRQVITPMSAIDVPFEHLDWSKENLTQESIDQRVEKFIKVPFKLDQAPLFKVWLIQLPDGSSLMLWVLHHIICDGWSMVVMLEELAKTYKTIEQGETVNATPLSVQYKEFAHWQNLRLKEPDMQVHRKYWLNRFEKDLTPLDLPADRPRPAVQRHKGEICRHLISEELTKTLRQKSEEQGLTLFHTLLTGMYALLYRYTGQEDLVVGVPSAGRPNEIWEEQFGLYLNILPIRQDVQGSESFTSLQKNLQQRSREALLHQEYPFDMLVQELGLNRDSSRTPVFDVFFNVQEFERHDAITQELGQEINEYPIPIQGSRFDLCFDIWENQSQLQISLEYDVDLFDHDRMERMLAHYEEILRSALDNPNQQIKELSYLPQSEQSFLLDTVNETKRDFDLSQSLADVLEEMATKYPHETALRFGLRSWTYAELMEKSNQVAHYLKEEVNVEHGDLVGVMMSRSDWMLIYLIGIIKAGAAYLPLDPSQPAARSSYVLGDCGTKLLLVGSEEVDLASAQEATNDLEGVQMLKVPTSGVLENYSSTTPKINRRGKDRMYVMYTSGSTGRPKGVVLGHASVINLLKSMQERPGMKPGEKFLAVTTYTFDISVLELFLPLITGGTVIVADQSSVKNPLELAQLLETLKPDIMQATPSLWQLLFEIGWKGQEGLRVWSGGEKLESQLADKLSAHTAETWNVYGPTETTIWSSVSQVDEQTPEDSIGSPVGNTQMYILDKDRQLAGVGVWGEIFIAGKGLAHGYLGRPDLTAERFVPNPWAEGEYMYRTGDRGRRLAEGEIQFGGRLDHQVKVSGHRIELGEIEHALMTLPEIERAVVLAVNQEGRTELRAYFTANSPVQSSYISGAVRRQLPAYMVPSKFYQLKSIPQNTNGKVDRNALLQIKQAEISPDNKPVERQESSDPVVQQVQLTFEQLLHTDYLDPNQNLFEQGLDSMRVIAAHQALNTKFSANMEIYEIFSFPTISQLSDRLRDKQTVGASAVPEVSIRTVDF